jgi:hypothetical protein
MGSVQSLNMHLVGIHAIDTSIHTIRQGFSTCYAYVQVATVTNIHRMKQTNRGSVTVMRIHAIEASIPAVRQGFCDCYAYV